MKRFVTMCAVVLCAVLSSKAQTVTIGSTTSTLNNFTIGPTHMGTATNVFKYSKHIAIYSAAELQAGGASGNTLIEKLRWDRVVPPTGGYTSSDLEFDIYIKGVSFTQHATSPINWANEVSGATLVYSTNTQNISTSAGWQEFVLQTPFLWNGTDNLEIFVETHKNSNSVGAAHFRYHTATNASAMTGSSGISTTSTRNSNRPNIQIDFAPAEPMGYVSNAVTQVTGDAIRGEADQAVLKLVITTEGGSNALSLKNLGFALTGTTNSPDVSKAKIYYTGSNSTFSATSLFAEVTNPTGNITLNGNQVLQTGANNFWLVYDVAAGAQPGNFVDGAISSFTLENSDGATSYGASGNPDGNREIRARLFGSYTVGTGGDYSTLAEAFSDVNTIGLESSTTLYIVSDLSETGVPALTQRSETNNGNYTLSIRPSGGAYTISGSQATGLIMFEGADRVVIDGSIDGSGNNLTFINNATGAAVFRINGPSATAGSNDITIRNTNIIAGSNTSTTTYGISVLGNDNDDLTIENNNISKASTAIIVRGTAVASSHDRMDIIGNFIGSGISSEYVLLRGIDVQYVANGIISQNQVVNMLPTSSTTLAAIELGQNVTNTAVTRNKVHNIKNPSTGGAYGVNISTSTGNTNNLIANNFISGISTSGNSTSTISNPFGIRIAGGSGHEVYYNTVNMSGNFGTTGMSSALIITSGSGINVRNNIFSNSTSGTSTTPRAYAIYSGVTSPFVSIDYNNYSVAGSNIGVLGYRSGSLANTLDEWRALTGQDANSISKTVNYVNALAGDLHLIEVDTVLAKGANLSTQLEDIDGETRKNTYIGADEVLPTIVISKHPQSLTQCVGSDYVLQTEASVNFNATLRYEWRRNGIPLFDNQTYSGTKTPTLRIQEAQPFDGGIYVLTIFSNSGTEVEAAHATVIVNSPIVIKTQPGSVLACLSENIQFSVPVDGTITGYQWQKAIPGGYMDLPGEKAAGLNLTNVNFATSGKYRLLVFGGCSGFDTVSSKEVSIFVVPQNNLIAEPEDKLASTGSSVTFTAEAYGGPSAGFQWYKGTTPLTDDERISGATSSALTISGLTLSDAGSDYSVQVQGRCGTGSSRQVTLTVIEPNIFITQQPMSDTVCAGSSLTFTTMAESSITGAELTYRWMKDGVTLAEGGEISGTTTSELKLNNITKADTGLYTVEITTVGGAPVTSNEARLTVASVPEINVQPVSSGVCENGFLELSVGAEAIGAGYQWKFNGTDIPGATTDKHLIQDATPADAGMYSVTITNECGSVTSNEADVTFNTKPSVTQQPEPKVNLNQGESFTLSVTAAGSGTLSYQWMKDEADIIGATEASYTVTSANKAEHMGGYKVKITNECGVVTSEESVVDIVNSINEEGTVAGVMLETNQPNPFSETTTIGYTLPQAMHVTISIMDVHGREVAVLANGFENAGKHTVTVNAAERNIPSGVYMYTMTTGSGYSKTRQLIIVK